MVVQSNPNYRDTSIGESADRKQRLRERFEVIKKLGQGTYGKVQLAVNKETKQEVAIKTIKKAKIENEQDLVRIRREIQIMSSIRHPHIIHIYEVFENQEKIVLIMQYASGGELYDYLGCHKKLEENEARRVFRQVASAIFYCHKNHICHRDLKLENILLDDKGNAKIADFGLSNVFDEKYKLKTFCGSPLYASPEIVRGTPYSGPEVDCWSLGVLLYTLVYGAMPFDGSNFKRLVKQISEGEYFEPKDKSGASGLIRRLLTVNINCRATVRDICNDWWVNQGYDHSLLKVATDMANLTPVRLDLLLALSSTSQEADQKVRRQISQVPELERIKSAQCNGYYSKSHPVHAPENGRQSITTGIGNNLNIHVTNDIRKGLFHGAENIKECKDGLTDYKKSQEEYQQQTTKAPPAAITPDKNESNILIIVQDLIKDVISKVEHQLNMSKTELLKNTAKGQIQRKPLFEGNIAQSMENENVTDTPVNETVIDTCVKEAPKFNSSPTLLESENQHVTYQHNIKTETDPQDSKSCFKSLAKTTAGVNTTGEVCEIKNISTKVKADISETTVPVQMIVFKERKNSIPNKIYEPQSRKTVVQVMEPDVVIPIFNVCSNIPKRSSDLLRPDKDLLLKHCPQSMLNETRLKTVDCLEGTNNSILPKNKNTDTMSVSSNVNGVSNKHCNNDASPDIKSVVTNDVLQTGTTSSESKCDNATGDIKENQPQTEAPKLPPRKRLLIKIPQQQKSYEKDGNNSCESDNFQKVYNPDRIESKFHQEEIRIPQESENLRNQISASAVSLTNRKASVCSEDTLLLTTHKTDSEVPESCPKLTERKSRRDSSKRSLSFNTKTVTNRKSPSIISNGVDCNVNNKGNNLEVSDNSLANVVDSSGAPNTTHNKMTEEIGDIIPLSQNLGNESNNNSSNEEGTINCNAKGKTESISVEKHSEMAELRKQTEMRETENSETGNIQIIENNISEENQKEKMESSRVWDLKEYALAMQQEIIFQELRQSKPLVKSKQRSLSRTRAMSMEFESLANMPVRIIGPPKKPPGKVEIPKSFDPNQVVTSPKVEMKEIIFIPTACVSENKEKIQKKIEKVKKSVIIIPPRRKSDAGVTSRKKKYTRSKTDFIIRGDELIASTENENSSTEVNMQCDPIYYETISPNEESLTPENMTDEAIANEMWYSAVSPDNESEECEQEFYHGSDVRIAQDIKQHRHSVDTESGYWTPPDMGNGEQSISQTNTKCKDERLAKKHEKSEKLILQRAAFKNSKLRMKLSDEGLDMCSLSSSLESGIYSWRQEDANGKRISPDSESSMKILSSLRFTDITSDGSYAPIARSFKKMTFPPEHSSTSELSESCSVMGNTEKDSVDAVGRENHFPQSLKLNEMDLKLIKPSDSQSSYGSNDISDDVFESWVEKEDALTQKEKYAEDKTNNITSNTNKRNGRDKTSRNWQHQHGWHSYSTDKESSDNDDDLDLMVDEYNQAVYGTDGLWQFLKSVNQNLSKQQKKTSQMSSKPACHRSKSQESKHPDDVISKTRPVTRSLSREERQQKGEKQLRHFVSEGKLPDVDSVDYFQDSCGNLNSTRYSSGYLASGSSLEDSGLLQKDFTGSTDCFQNYPNHISIYGTLRRDKVFHSTSTLTSPSTVRRKKSLQNAFSSGDLADTYYNTEISAEDSTKYSGTSEQSRKLSLYGTMQPRRLSQQGSTQNQILLSTDDGYQLLYNEKSKKGSSSEAYYDSFGSAKSLVGRASSEINVSKKENTVEDFEKLLMSDYDDGSFKRPLSSAISNRNTPLTEPSYHLASNKTSSRNKKELPDKGIRRVSFSTDVKTSKSDYHSSLRLNSLNKVREANEELLSTTSHKPNAYEEEQQGGSLLEALKTYGYRGIMSQKLHTGTDTYEPRFNYRLPTDCILSSGLNVTDWDNFEYTSTENNLAYQQPIYLPIHPMEYYQCKTFAPKKRNLGEYPDLSCDDGTIFKDTLRSQRLHEDDALSRRKSLQKLKDLNDLHSLHSDQHVRENWDVKYASLNRKKSFDSNTTAFPKLQRNSTSEKSNVHERYENDNGEPTDIQTTESHTPKQTENPIEVLSEKIQALKSRCQRKSLDESKLQKELDESGVPSPEEKVCERGTVSDVENKFNYNHSDLVDEQETESSESVSDRIWRKSFYSRFNDASTIRKKKSFMDSEFMSGQNSIRSTGKFNIDEEGGIEEPWMSTSLKRRNSLYSRSLPRQTKGPTSLDSSKKDFNDCSTKSFKRAELLSNIERKSHLYQMIDSTALSQSSVQEQNITSIYDKKSLKSTKDEDHISKIATNLPQTDSSSDGKILRQEIRENRIDLAEVAHSSDTTTTTSNTCPNQTDCDRTEKSSRNLEPTDNLSKGTNNIPEEVPVTVGNSTSTSENSDYSATTLINPSSPTHDSFSLRSAEVNTVPEKNLEKLETEENSSECCASVKVTDAQQYNRLEADEEE